jgi:hypothetical protein
MALMPEKKILKPVILKTEEKQLNQDKKKPDCLLTTIILELIKSRVITPLSPSTARSLYEMLDPFEKSNSHNLHIVAGEVQFPAVDAALESLSRVKHLRLELTKPI